MSIAQIVAINAAVLIVLFLVLWRVAVAIKDVTFIDSVWPTGMVWCWRSRPSPSRRA